MTRVAPLRHGQLRLLTRFNLADARTNRLKDRGHHPLLTDQPCCRLALHSSNAQASTRHPFWRGMWSMLYLSAASCSAWSHSWNAFTCRGLTCRGELLLCHCLLCCAVLCCAVLCCAVLCCAVLCCAVLQCAVLCYAVLQYAVLQYAVLCCAVLCCAVLCCAVLCCAVLCCAVLCYSVLCCAMLCCNMLCCAVLCCAELRRAIPGCAASAFIFACAHAYRQMCWPKQVPLMFCQPQIKSFSGSWTLHQQTLSELERQLAGV